MTEQVWICKNFPNIVLQNTVKQTVGKESIAGQL